MASRSYTEQTIKQLFGSAAGRCAFPSCRRKLIHPATEQSSTTIIGDIAHILAFSDEGPRADSTMSDKDRNSFENLLLLCAACHRLVDGQPDDYPDDTLRAMKNDHLDWVDRNLENEMSDIRFPELEVVCKRIISSELADSTAFNSLPPRDKIDLNDLGPSSSKKITMGLMQAPLVESYLQSMVTHVDPDFPPRLIAGFRQEYDKHRSTGIKGDGLFVLLEHFAAGGSADFERHAAGLAVLAHLFQVCDIFETTP
ncbi:HNH endonuclease [Streptomyces sp. WM6368]|uniref:HNH endonuclease n=1 Tax=Streptomyces sp. WM6368 TaxID=1415554 RepID=UPI000AC130AA|nr:HNH endonuclease [Streptomyces sp. WM6368]